LEHKWRYYEGAKYDVNPIDDTEYDFLEEKYKSLAKKLGEKIYTTEHVGFPMHLGSAKIVNEKMIKNKGKSDITFKWKKDKKVEKQELRVLQGGKDGSKKEERQKREKRKRQKKTVCLI